jgi:hypothetical protein
MGGGEERMGPDETGEDGDESDDVCTVTAMEPGVEAPIVRPLMVTVNAAVAPMVPPDVVSTTADKLVAAQVKLRPGALLAATATTGVMEGTKKFDGYVSVTRPPGGTEFITAKVRVAWTLAVAAMRPDVAITNAVLSRPTGALKVKPLCITATRNDGRSASAGALMLSVTTISTADTVLQLVDTEPSRNRALHAAPCANGLPVTVTEEWEASSTRGVTAMMTGAWASRSDTA